MKKMQYVGSRAQGVTVRFPYPHVAKSAERASVVFSGPGDVQDIENHQDAADLFQHGAGQFVYEAVPKEAKSEALPATSDNGDAPKAPKRKR